MNYLIHTRMSGMSLLTVAQVSYTLHHHLPSSKISLVSTALPTATHANMHAEFPLGLVNSSVHSIGNCSQAQGHHHRGQYSTVLLEGLVESGELNSTEGDVG